MCDVIDAPREAEHAINPADKSTVKALLAKALETPHGTAILLLAYSGMRRGEVCAVRREHVGLDSGTLGVTGSVSRQNRRLTITPPKSKTSRRSIHPDRATVAVLRAHLARQAEYRISIGAAYQDQGFLFASPTGGLLDPDILTKTWQRLCRELGVRYRLHDLRHAHATTLIEAGIHIKTVQNRLGHSSPSLTMAVYAHVSPGMDKEAAGAYAEACVSKRLAKALSGQNIFRASPNAGWPFFMRCKGHDPRRTRTDNLVIKSHLLCQIELAGHAAGERARRPAGG